MATGHDDQMQGNPTADRPWGDVAQRARDWFAGYDQGRADALVGDTPDGVAGYIEGMTAGLGIAREEANRLAGYRAVYEDGIDRALDEAQRLLREGRTLDAHRAISRARRCLEAPHDARLARLERR